MVVVEYILRALLLVQAIISLIGMLWSGGYLSALQLLFGVSFMVSAFSVAIAKKRKGRELHFAIPSIGAVSSVYLTYSYWSDAMTYEASMFRVYYMFAICCVFMYFAIISFRRTEEKKVNV